MCLTLCKALTMSHVILSTILQGGTDIIIVPYIIAMEQIIPNSVAQNNQHLLYLSVPVHQKLGNDLTGCHWPSLQISEGFTRTRVCASKMAHFTVLSVGRKPWFLPYGLCLGLPKYPYNMAASFPQTNQFKRKRKAEATMSDYLASEVTHHHFHNISFVEQVNLIQHGKGLHAAPTLGGRDYWGHLGGWLPQSSFYT